MELIDAKMLLYGYQTYNDEMTSTADYKDSLEIIKSAIFRKSNLPLVSNYLYDHDARKFYRTTFEMMDKNVRFMTKSDALNIYNAYRKNPAQINILANTCINKESERPCFEVPVFFKDGASSYGKTEKPLVLPNDEETLKKMPVAFTGVILGNTHDALLGATYVHELAHMLLERNKGSVYNYLNSEVISIFLQELAALNLDDTGKLLKQAQTIRYQDIKGSLKADVKELERKKYTVSTLLAHTLVDIYKESSKAVQKDILNDVRSVFEGNMQLEQMLDKYDVVFGRGLIKDTTAKRLVKKKD